MKKSRGIALMESRMTDKKAAVLPNIYGKSQRLFCMFYLVRPVKITTDLGGIVYLPLTRGSFPSG